MPPKAKFMREEVIAAALDILRESGKEGITARALGKKLASSARPVFTLFSGMEEILSETEKAARRIYGGYVAAGLKEDVPFKGVGRGYLRFAKEEPKLFQLLFFGERRASAGSVLYAIEDNYREILQSITGHYPLTEEQAKELYFHLFVYTHGIASLVATGVCDISEEESDEMLTAVFRGLYREIGGKGL